jgi:hypothetical protein
MLKFYVQEYNGTINLQLAHIDKRNANQHCCCSYKQEPRKRPKTKKGMYEKMPNVSVSVRC